MPSFNPNEEPESDGLEWPEMDALEAIVLGLENYHKKFGGSGSLMLQVDFNCDDKKSPHYSIFAYPTKTSSEEEFNKLQDQYEKIMKEEFEEAFGEKLNTFFDKGASFPSFNEKYKTTPQKIEPIYFMNLDSIKNRMKP
jgi:hypothetical protein